MLIKFSIPAGTSVSMFEKDATALIKMMNHSGAIPSAIANEDLPAALAALRNHLAEKAAEPDPCTDEDLEQRAPSLSTKAFPLLELLEKAIKRNKSVMWEADKGFF